MVNDRHVIALIPAVLLGAAVFFSGCASKSSLDVAVANADHQSWLRADPDALAALQDQDVQVEVIRLGDGDEIGFMTAYATPRIRARRARGGAFLHALHEEPTGGISSTRREIHEGELLAGQELCWLDDPLEAYLVQVNGSAIVAWVDEEGVETGEETFIVWSASNEHSYSSLGRMAIDAGLASPGEMSLGHLRHLHLKHPERIQALMLENPRYIMFRALDPTESLSGSRGRTLVPGVSLATDPRHPTDAILLVEPLEGGEPFLGLVHDGGAAIVGPQRIDRYLGVGEDAMDEAGTIAMPARVYLVKINASDGDS